MYNIYSIIKHNIDTIVSLNTEEYPELIRIRNKTTVLTHLYAIMRHMLTYSNPLWPTRNKRYFLFSERYLAAWSRANNITGDLKTWQSHKIFLLHTGLIKTFTVIGDQTDPVLQKIWDAAVSNGYHSETLWTVPLYTPKVLKYAERIAKEYRENHVNLTHIRKNIIIRIWGHRTADSLYRSSRHDISTEELHVEHCLIEALKDNVEQKGFTTIAEVCAFALALYVNATQSPEKMEYCRTTLVKLLEQKRLFFNRHGYEYHRIRKADRAMALPDDYKGFIITPKN